MLDNKAATDSIFVQRFVQEPRQGLATPTEARYWVRLRRDVLPGCNLRYIAMWTEAGWTFEGALFDQKANQMPDFVEERLRFHSVRFIT
jgi:hypothetical protein